MLKGRSKKMIWILGVISFIIIAIVIFLVIPYSPMSREFQRDVQWHTEQQIMFSGFFSETDIAHLPEPLQKHFRVSGIIGQQIMSGFDMLVPATPLYQSRDARPLSLDYQLHLFAYKPIRLAYMSTTMFGIPFEAYDSLQDGVGFMRGVIGKVITLFNETGVEMDRGQLLTYLGELALLPSMIFNDYVSWEPIDDFNVKATITYGDLSGSGIFTFGEDGFMQTFRTDERTRVHTDGSMDFLPWSAVYEDWSRSESGMYKPSGFKVIWHEPEGDFVYFESINGFILSFIY